MAESPTMTSLSERLSMIADGDQNNTITCLAVNMKWESVCSHIRQLQESGKLVGTLQKESLHFKTPLLHLAMRLGKSDLTVMRTMTDCISNRNDLVQVIKLTDAEMRNILHLTVSQSTDIGQSVDILDYILGLLERHSVMEVLKMECSQGQTVLQSAISHDNIMAVESILRQILPHPERGSRSRSLPIANTRLEYFSIPSKRYYTVFHQAGLLGLESIFNKLLEAISHKERLILASKTDPTSRQTVLHCVASGGKYKMLETLLNLLPSGPILEQLLVNADENGNNAVHIAANVGLIKCFELLLSKASSQLQLYLLSRENGDGKTPFNLLHQFKTETKWIGTVTELEKKLAFELQVLKETVSDPILGNVLTSTPYEERFQTSRGILTMKEPLWDMLVIRSVPNAVRYAEMIYDRNQQIELLKTKIKSTLGKSILHHAALLGDRTTITKLLFLAGGYRNVLLTLKDDNGCHPDYYASNKEAKRLLEWSKDSKEGYYYLPTPPQVLIIYNTTGREGADTEMMSIAEIMPKFSVLPSIKRDLTAEQMLDSIHQVIQHCPHQGGISGLIVIIMSHGERDAVCDNNGNLVPIQDIIYQMSPSMLDGVPKVLVMQCCQSRPAQPVLASNPGRSGTHDAATLSAMQGYNEDAALAKPLASLQATPYHLTKSDMSILISTVRGGLAERNVFIPILAKQLQNSTPKDDINDVFLRTHQEMRVTVPDQTPRYESTMTYKLNLKLIFQKKDKKSTPSPKPRSKSGYRSTEATSPKQCLLQ